MLANWESLLIEATLQEVILWYDLHRLQEHYVSILDSGHFEEWPSLFTDDGVYEIVPNENSGQDAPFSIMHCFGRAMMHDRIISLRMANDFEPHSYRHLTSGLEFSQIDGSTIEMQSNYVLVQTLPGGESRVYQAGRYVDRVVRTPEGWRYQRKRAVYDASPIHALLAVPV
jgi:anthranilate 1,2-dioxygenase small subunit